MRKPGIRHMSMSNSLDDLQSETIVSSSLHLLSKIITAPDLCQMILFNRRGIMMRKCLKSMQHLVQL